MWFVLRFLTNHSNYMRIFPKFHIYSCLSGSGRIKIRDKMKSTIYAQYNSQLLSCCMRGATCRCSVRTKGKRRKVTCVKLAQMRDHSRAIKNIHATICRHIVSLFRKVKSDAMADQMFGCLRSDVAARLKDKIKYSDRTRST